MCIDMTNFNLKKIFHVKIPNPKHITPRLVFIIFIFYVMSILFVSSIIGVMGAEQLDSNLSRSRIGKPDVTIMTTDVYNTPGIAKPAGFDQEFQHETSTIEFSDDEPIEGQTVIINTTVFNIGTEGTDAIVYFYDGPIENDDLIGTDMVTILPLSYDEAQTFWNTTYELEFHTIFVLIIPEDPENETDPDNNEANKDIIINQIPIPLFQAPSSSFEDDTIEFDGSYTVDTQSDLDAGLMFYWNFGDPYGNQSNPSEVSGSNLSRPAHIYTKSGEYNITLRVQDDGGAYDIITAKLIISNIAPIAQFNVSNTIPFEDEIITFDASESWDTAQIELV